MNEMIKELELKLMMADMYDCDWKMYDEAGMEATSDQAYKAMWKAIREAARLIEKISDGKIDEVTATRMVLSKRETILDLVNRLSA